MNKSSTTKISNQKAKGNVAAPSVLPKPDAKPSTDKANMDKASTEKASTDKPAIGVPEKNAPGKAADVPMHAAKGSDDIMSQPQASQTGKKKS